jgi:hypothetical protein
MALPSASRPSGPFILGGSVPDCRYVAYDFLRGEARTLATFSYTTRDQREMPLITHAADDRFLGWSLDGKWIVFSSNRSGTVDLWAGPGRRGKDRGCAPVDQERRRQINPKGLPATVVLYYRREFRYSDVYRLTRSG